MAPVAHDSSIDVEWISLMRLQTIMVAGVTVLSLVLAAACGPRVPDEPDPWRIVPGKSFGPVDQSTSRSDLDQFFGASNVEEGTLYIGEGFCVPATIVFPGTDNELTVAWQSPEHDNVAMLRVEKPGGRWSTAEGIRVGTTVAQLEELKGEPIEFGGFGWDYGGGADWQGLGLRLAPDAKIYRSLGNDPRFGEILGEKTVRSDHPLIRRMKITVVLIQISFGAPYGERDCR